jgi:hypothetical protein
VIGVEEHRTPLTGGGQQLMIEAVEPFEVHVSPTFVTPRGDSATISLSSDFTLTNQRWYFHPGDTLPTPQYGSGLEFACPAGANTCTRAMTESGRIYVSAMVEGNASARRHSDVVWVRDSVPSSCGTGSEPVPSGDEGPSCPPPPPDTVPPPALALTLTCPNTVTRGDEITCVAGNDVGGLAAFDLIWRFAADAVPFTPAASETFSGRTVRHEASGVTPVWEGRMVHPGTVSVEAYFEGFLVGLPVTAHVQVTGRDWLEFRVYLDDAGYNDAQISIGLPVPSSSDLITGRNHRSPYVPPGDLSTNFFAGGATYDAVTGGPNDGYYFVGFTDFAVHRAYSVNRWIDDNPGHRYSIGGMPNVTTWQYVRRRGKDPSITRDNTQRHEVGSTGQVSHQGRLKEAAGDFESCGDLYETLELLTAPDLKSIATMVADQRDNAYFAMMWANTHDFVYGHQTPDAWVADWYLNPPDILTTSYSQQSEVRREPDSTRCNLVNLR